MKNLLSPKYPNLMCIKPRVQFHDGRATVADEDAEVLLARTALGIVLEGEVPIEVTFTDNVTIHNPDGEAGDDKTPEIPTGAVEFPSKKATVAEWVAFMAKHEIKHPDDATKAEMKELAEAHFAESE